MSACLTVSSRGRFVTNDAGKVYRMVSSHVAEIERKKAGNTDPADSMEASVWRVNYITEKSTVLSKHIPLEG